MRTGAIGLALGLGLLSAGPAAAQPLPTLDVVIGKDILRLTLTNAPARLPIPEQFNPSFLEEVQRAYPQYFSDLGPLPADAR